MRFLFGILFLAVPCFAATDRAAELEALKNSFPQHVTGEVNDKSDPLVIECFTKYRKAVEALTLDTLSSGVGKLRKNLETEIRHYENRNSETGVSDPLLKSKVMTPSMRHAIEKNFTWLKSRLRPYVARLESFQRGRPQK
jgi:hypothetical protein